MPTPRKSKPRKSAAGDTTPAAKPAQTAGTRKKPPVTPEKSPKARPAPKTKSKVKLAKSAGAGAAPGTKGHQTPAATATKSAAPKLPPRKPAVDAEMVKQLREALVHQRERMLSVVRSTQAQLAEKTKDLPDVSDQASEGYGDELAVGLMAIEAAQLEDIEAAIQRIDGDTYGLCVDCGKPIPRRRLEVLPFARRCLACEGARESRVRTQAAYEEEEDS